MNEDLPSGTADAAGADARESAVARPAEGADPTLAEAAGAGPVDADVAGADLAGAEAAAPDAGGPFAALENAYELLSAGGPVVLMLIAMSVFALAIVLAKALQFQLAAPRAAALKRIVGLYREGRLTEALALARRRRGADRAPVLIALEGVLEARPERQTREEAYRVAAENIETLGGWLRPLEVIAALAPLLGLFGTVLGMIEAFARLEAAGSNVDPAILSGGIWQALLTTAAGLAVAMPAVVCFNWFERRLERAESTLDSTLAAIFASDAAARKTRHEPARVSVL